MAVDEVEIIDELQVFGLTVDDKTVVEKLCILSDRWGLNASTLAEKYVAFQRNNDLPDHISSKIVELFDRDTSAKLDMAKNRTPKSQVVKPAKNLLTKNMLQELMVADACSQQDLLSSYGISSPLIPIPITRTTSNKENELEVESQETQLVASYPANAADLPIRVDITEPLNWNPVVLNTGAYGHRYMNQHTIENAEILDNWTWRNIKRILSNIPEESFIESDQKIEQSQPTNPNSLLSLISKNDCSQPTKTETSLLERTMVLRPVFSRIQAPSLIPGRVTAKLSVPIKGSTELSKVSENNRSVAETKIRLHPSNVALVGLRRAERSGSETDAVHLDLGFSRDLSCYSVYSGQPLLIRGVNPTGCSLGVMEIFQIPISKPPAINLDKCSANLHIMVACGPYTLSNSHDPTGLFNLLRSVKQSKPHVLILLGPFVDSEHPGIQSYSETTYEELFQSRVNSVSEWCSHLSIKLIIVSSWREVHHDPVYPTPPIDKSWTEKTPDLLSSYTNVQFAPDPCLIQIEEYVFGITTVDVLKDLSCEEISAGCSGSDRITRLCRHIIASSSFYPVHPPDDDLPLDYPLWSQYAQFSVTPHCLILPSKLRQFTKDVDGVLCINPGFVSRGESFGSYAEICVSANEFPSPNGNNYGIELPMSNNVPSEHSSSTICDRTSVLIKRI
ncbi:DNA polymerase alpha subunit B [Schistosoma japonicum]|nr:DNA polymerase alpha subunit B [Schistosoma japonicum]KAH8850521.1 DNA polymerase alpha subunit B [Schistosoma japonicum]